MSRLHSIDVRDGTVRGHDVRADSIGGREIDEAALDASKIRFPVSQPPTSSDEAVLLRALVYGDGARFYTHGVVAVNSTTGGVYQVVFDRDVHACAIAATPTGLAYGVPVGGVASIDVAAYPDPNNARAIYVLTQQSDGRLVQRDFYVLVSC